MSCILTITLLLSLFGYFSVADKDCVNCEDCAKCAGVEHLGDGTKRVTLDFLGCKGSDISWACCTGSNAGSKSCVRETCDGVSGTDRTCNEVSQMTVIVPSPATRVQVHFFDSQ